MADGSQAMDVELEALSRAIQQVRVEGAHAADPHYDPLLLRALHIPETTPGRRAQPFVVKALFTCASQLDAEEGQAFLGAAGFAVKAPRRSGTRMEAVARRLGVSTRTAYRRVEQATRAIAGQLLSWSQAPALEDRDWVMTMVDCRVDLRSDEPIIVLDRTIQSLRDGLDHFDEALSFPRLGNRAFDYLPLEGCRLGQLTDMGNGAWAVRLRLSQPLRLAERLDFVVSIRLPGIDALEPVFGFFPRTTSYNATLRLLFGRRRPVDLELFEGNIPIGSFPQVVTPQPLGPEAREFRHTFLRMTPGRSYGVRWAWADDPPTDHPQAS